MSDKNTRNVMTLSDVLEAAGLNLDTELVVASDSEGNKFRTVTDIQTDVVVDPNSEEDDLVVYNSDDLADDIGITEDAWEEMKRDSPETIVLW